MNLRSGDLTPEARSPHVATVEHDHGHSHAHGHAHGHAHHAVDGHASARAANRRRMLVALALTGLYTIAEAVGGKVSGSLALLADAGHMLSDTAALALAVFAMWVAQKPRDARRTYGYQRTEILAALANAATLLVVSVSILVEAYQRLRAPAIISTKLMMAVAAGGLVNNLVCMGVLSAGKDDNLNLRGAWLHLLTDALGSVGALLSGVLVGQFGWSWADPVASALIALLVMRSAWGLLSATVSVLMEHAPEHVDVNEVRGAIVAHADVGDVHDLHVWTITSGLVCLSAHVVTHAQAEAQQAQLAALTRLLRDRFRIDHVTLQLEHASYPADTCAGCD